MTRQIGIRELALREMRRLEANAPKKIRDRPPAVPRSNEPAESKEFKMKEIKVTPVAGEIVPGMKVTVAGTPGEGKIVGPKKPRKAKPKGKVRPRSPRLDAPAPAAPKDRKPVPAQAIADFICRTEGASMAELVKKFKIEPHPMRAKIHYVRHQMGYAVEMKDGRYVGKAPKKGKTG